MFDRGVRESLPLSIVRVTSLSRVFESFIEIYGYYKFIVGHPRYLES